MGAAWQLKHTEAAIRNAQCALQLFAVIAVLGGM